MKTIKMKNDGSALPLVLFNVVLLLIMGTSILSLGLNLRTYAFRNTSEIAARCAADAGLVKALYDMNAKLAAKTLNNGTLPSASNVTLPNSNLTFSYTVTKDVSGIYTIESTGNSGSITKTVYGPLILTGPTEGMIVAETLYMKNNGVITGSCGTLSAAAGAFDVKKGTITGDAFVGVGGDPKNIKCTVLGSKYALSSLITLADTSTPSEISTAGPNTNWNTPNNPILGTPGTTTYVKYTGVTINGKLTINGNVIMFVDGNLSDAGSGIYVNNNSSLTLFISGKFGPNGNGVDMTSATNDPSVLRIYGVGSTSQEFTLGKNNTTIIGKIYAPKADVTIGKNNAAFTGQIIAHSFSCKNNADITFDPKVCNGYTQYDPLAQFAVKGWHE
jgi:hypothetical protein